MEHQYSNTSYTVLGQVFTHCLAYVATYGPQIYFCIASSLFLNFYKLAPCKHPIRPLETTALETECRLRTPYPPRPFNGELQPLGRPYINNLFANHSTYRTLLQACVLSQRLNRVQTGIHSLFSLCGSTTATNLLLYLTNNRFVNHFPYRALV